MRRGDLDLDVNLEIDGGLRGNEDMAGVKLGIPPRRQCAQGKIRHHNRLIAEEYMRSLERSDKYNRPHAGRLNIYWCGECEAWHVGHSAGVKSA